MITLTKITAKNIKFTKNLVASTQILLQIQYHGKKQIEMTSWVFKNISQELNPFYCAEEKLWQVTNYASPHCLHWL